MVKVTALFSDEFVQQHDGGSIVLSDMGVLRPPGVVFEPNDPQASENELRRYYSAEVETEAEAQELLNSISGLPRVEASWIKPRDEEPN